MCVKVLLYFLSALPACSSLKISAQVERNELDPVADDVTLSTLNCSNRFTAGCWKKGGHSVGKKSTGSKTPSDSCEFTSVEEVMEHLEMLGYCIEYLFMAGLYKEECYFGVEPDSAAILYFPKPPFGCVPDTEIPNIEEVFPPPMVEGPWPPPLMAEGPWPPPPMAEGPWPPPPMAGGPWPPPPMAEGPWPPPLMAGGPWPPPKMPFPPPMPSKKKMPFPKEKMEIFPGFAGGMMYKSVYVSIEGDSCFSISKERGMIDCFDGHLENRWTEEEGPLEETADLLTVEDFFEDWYSMPSDFSIKGFPGLFKCAGSVPSIPFEKIMDDSLQYIPLSFKETKRKERGGGGESVMFIAKGIRAIKLPPFCPKFKKIFPEGNPFEIMSFR